jgi:hypothetical protein
MVSTETLEQPNQDQLRVWIGIDPQIDCIEPIADICKAERRERFRELGLRQQWPGGEAVADINHLVGDAGKLQASRSGITGGRRSSASLRSLPHWRDQHGIVPPQIIVGQMRAAPPAVDPIVAAEVFFVREHGPAEIGEREPAALIR